MSERPTIEDFRTKALAKPEVKAEYDGLSALFETKRRMIALRKRAGITQQQMADLLGTHKGNISRLESVSTENSPRLATVADYARVLGYRLKIDFEPEPKTDG